MTGKDKVSQLIKSINKYCTKEDIRLEHSFKKSYKYPHSLAIWVGSGTCHMKDFKTDQDILEFLHNYYTGLIDMKGCLGANAYMLERDNMRLKELNKEMSDKLEKIEAII